MGCEAVPQLLSGDLDALITIGEYSNPLCDSVRVGTLPVGVFLSSKHPLRKKKIVTMSDLAPYPVCHAEGLDDFNETIVNLYLRCGLASNSVSRSLSIFRSWTWHSPSATCRAVTSTLL